MNTVTKRMYEAMFLVDSSAAASDWDGVLKTIRTILERADAEIISIRKWDERRLAYEIAGQARGTYILCYFKGGGRNAGIERDVQLSDRIMRVLILNAEHIGEQDMCRQTPVELLEGGRQGESDSPRRSAPAEAQKPKADQETPEVEVDVTDEDEAVNSDDVEDDEPPDEQEKADERPE